VGSVRPSLSGLTAVPLYILRIHEYIPSRQADDKANEVQTVQFRVPMKVHLKFPARGFDEVFSE